VKSFPGYSDETRYLLRFVTRFFSNFLSEYVYHLILNFFRPLRLWNSFDECSAGSQELPPPDAGRLNKSNLRFDSRWNRSEVNAAWILSGRSPGRISIDSESAPEGLRTRA
jgi:hypothetical protein